MTLKARLQKLESTLGSPHAQPGYIRLVISDEEGIAARKSLLAEGVDPGKILIIRLPGPERMSMRQFMAHIAEQGHRIYDRRETQPT